MKDLKVTDSGDIDFLVDDLSVVSDETDLRQSILMILSTRLGEFFLDDQLGLNWDNLFGKNYNPEYLETDISDALVEQESRIRQVVSIEFETNERLLNIRIKMIGENAEEMVEEVSLNAE